MHIQLALWISCLAVGILGQARDGADPHPSPLLLSDAGKLLTSRYYKEERGYVKNSDGMYHIATNTWMPGSTGAMIDWWFGWITTTDQYKMWHPTDHIHSEWSGPHGNSKYIGGSHLVYERIGGEELKLRINFRSPAQYFGDDWQAKFKAANVTTAICGRVGFWSGKGSTSGVDVGHLMHLVHNEEGGVRMRSRFWLGDVGIPLPAILRSAFVPMTLVTGLVEHASEEMHYLQGFLPGLYNQQHAPRPKRRWEREVIPWTNE